MLDDKCIFEDFVKFPRDSVSQDSSALVIAHNFDGLIGCVYIFSESLPQTTLELVRRLSGGRAVSGLDESTTLDLSTTAVAKDARLQPALQRVIATYHPMRIYGGRAVDVHGGRHGLLMQPSFPWSSASTRELLDSMGGVSFLLPLFPRLLIDQEQMDAFVDVDASYDVYDSFPAHLGTSLAGIHEDEFVDSLFSTEVVRVFSSDKAKLTDEGCVGLLLELLVCCFRGRRDIEADMLHERIVEMIEYVLAKVSPVLLRAERESLAVALVGMTQAVETEGLLSAVVSRLVFNFNIWQRCTVFLQRLLVERLVMSVRINPELFVSSIGVTRLLEQVEQYPSSSKKLLVSSTLFLVTPSFSPDSPKFIVVIRRAES